MLRLRPILMTTGAMVLGAVPLALASGAGAESRQQIGWVIVGGLLLGTFLTLFVVPTVYSLVARRQAAAPELEDSPPRRRAGRARRIAIEPASRCPSPTSAASASTTKSAAAGRPSCS